MESAHTHTIAAVLHPEDDGDDNEEEMERAVIFVIESDKWKCDFINLCDDDSMLPSGKYLALAQQANETRYGGRFGGRWTPFGDRAFTD